MSGVSPIVSHFFSLSELSFCVCVFFYFILTFVKLTNIDTETDRQRS